MPILIVLLATLAWGWTSWIASEREWTLPTILSSAGFVLATSSVLLAVVALAYGASIGGFPYWDSRLLSIYRWAA